MKLKDIEVGKVYAVGTDSYQRRALVLEVGELERRVWRGGFHPLKEKVKGARVHYWKERYGDVAIYSTIPDGTIHVVLPQQVLRTWDEQEKINADKRAAAAKAQDRINETMMVAHELRKVLLYRGIDARPMSRDGGDTVEIRLTVQEAKGLLLALR